MGRIEVERVAEQLLRGEGPDGLGGTGCVGIRRSIPRGVAGPSQFGGGRGHEVDWVGGRPALDRHRRSVGRREGEGQTQGYDADDQERDEQLLDQVVWGHSHALVVGVLVPLLPAHRSVSSIWRFRLKRPGQPIGTTTPRRRIRRMWTPTREMTPSGSSKSEAEHRRKAADEEHGANPKPTPELQSQPVRVDGRNRRNANDGLEGHFVDVVDGEHKGRFGAFTEVAEREKDGYPKTILVRTRDEFNELLTVAYEHVRHSQSHGGR